MNRAPQAILIISFLAFCWFALQAVHELGHIFGALLTGAEIHKVYLHPLILSRTDLLSNPNPIIVTWMGPIAGAFLPLAILLVVNILKTPCLYMFRFFSGFCLIANGIYITFGPTQGALDTAVLFTHGASRWHMIAFGLLTIPLGFFLWHNQGRYFGFGNSKGRVDKTAVIVSVFLLGTIIILELLYSMP